MRGILIYFSLMCAYVLCCPVQGQNQACLKSFFADIANGENLLFLQDGVRTAENGFVVTGYDAVTAGPVIIKLDESGNISWTKGFEGLNFSRNVLATADGNLLVTATGFFKIFLLKYNLKGALIWAKEITGAPGGNFRIETIRELPNGDLVILMSSSDLDSGNRNYLARLNSTGEFIWKKELNYEAGMVLANNMYIDSDNIYMAAEYTKAEGLPYIDIAQFSLATGGLGWRNRLKSLNNQFTNPVITKTGTDLYIASAYGTLIENSGRVVHNTMVANLQAGNGQFQQAYVFETPNLHYAPIIFSIDLVDGDYFLHTNDNKLLLAQLMHDGADTALHIIKFELDGKVIWAKKYPELRTQDVKSMRMDGDGFLLTGRTFSGYGNITTRSFLMAVDEEGNLLPGNIGQEAACKNLSANVVTKKVSVQEQVSGFASVSEVPDFAIKNYVVNERIAVFTSSIRCSANTTTCNLLRIDIPAKICEGSVPFTCVAKRASGCQLPVAWSFDTLLLRQVAVTDTSITLIALKEGTDTLTATVNSACGSNTVRQALRVNRAAVSLQLGADTTACFPPDVSVNAGVGFSKYFWSNGSTDSIILISAPGTYKVTITDACGTVASDSIIIRGNAGLFISLGDDINFCNGDSARLDAGPGFERYQWNTGSTAASIFVNTRGTFVVTGTTGNGCIASDTLVVLNVWDNPVVNIVGKDYVCAGRTQLLSSGSFNTYLWQDGSTSSTYNATGLGTYSLLASNAQGCTASDTLVISAIKPLPANFLFADSAICSFESIQLNANTVFSQYQWNTGAQSAGIEVNTAGLYWLEVTDSDQCTGRDSINILSKVCIAGFFVPTAFSPNGDGLNDTFKPLLYGNVLSYHFTVYNRWGVAVFQTKDPKKGWDGTLKQKKQQGDVFIWKCQFQLEGDSIRVEKGTVVLVR